MIARLRRCLFGAALVLASGLVLASALPTPARADDLTTCIGGWAKKALNPDDVALALDFMANHGDCLTKLADPSGRFAAIVTALGALKKAGAFSTAEQCQNAAANLLGEVVIQVSDTVGGVIGLKIPAYIENQGKDAVVDWVQAQANSNPVIAAIASEMDCGCAVAAYGVDHLEELLETLVEVAEACAGLIGDFVKMAEKLGEAILGGLTDAAEALGALGEEMVELVEDCLTAAAGQKSVIDCLAELPDLGAALGSLLGTAAGAVGDFLDALGGFFSWAKPLCCGTVGKIGLGSVCGGCSPPPKPQKPKVDIGCQGVACEKGFQCGGELNDRCVPCADIMQLVSYGVEKSLCGCGVGFSPAYKSTPGGPVLTGCTCEAPKVVKQAPLVIACVCPTAGETLQYAADGTAFCGCPWGQSMQGGKCQPVVCKPPFALDAAGKKCVQVQPVSLPQPKDTPAKAQPAIPQCPPNYRLVSGACIPDGPIVLPGQPKTPAKAAPVVPKCPPGFLWTGTSCVQIGTAVPGKPGPAKAAPVIPTCPGNTKWDGTKCAPPAARAAKPKSTPTLRVQPVVPQCPPNTRWDGRTCAALPAVQIRPGTLKLAPLVPQCPANTRWDGKRCAPLAPTLQRAPTLGPVPQLMQPAPQPQIR